MYVNLWVPLTVFWINCISLQSQSIEKKRDVVVCCLIEYLGERQEDLFHDCQVGYVIDNRWLINSKRSPCLPLLCSELLAFSLLSSPLMLFFPLLSSFFLSFPLLSTPLLCSTWLSSGIPSSPLLLLSSVHSPLLLFTLQDKLKFIGTAS